MTVRIIRENAIRPFFRHDKPEISPAASADIDVTSCVNRPSTFAPASGQSDTVTLSTAALTVPIA